MKTIAVLTAGGTIAMTMQGEAGALPSLGPAELARMIPTDIARISTEEVFNLPSPHLTVDHLQRLRSRVRDLILRQGVAGVVITHGTDAMEETAFYLDITLPPRVPVVLTGAMRHASQAGYDGAANMGDAVRVAASDAAREMGVMIVMNETIHAARWVTKGHTQALDAFVSPDAGPIGRIEGKVVQFYSRPLHHPVLSSGALEPHVTALSSGLDASPDLLDYCRERGVRGIVIEGMGAGHVPPTWLDSIRRLIAQGIPVVIATRCHAGPTRDEYGYEGAHRDLKEAGCLFADGLNTAKCRIKLMAILGQTTDRDEIAHLWEQV